MFLKEYEGSVAVDAAGLVGAAAGAAVSAVTGSPLFAAFFPFYASHLNPHPITTLDLDFPTGQTPTNIDVQLDYGSIQNPVVALGVPANFEG